MTPAEWHEIKPQLHDVLLLEPGLRAGRMAQLVQRYPALRGELEGLAASYNEITDDYLDPQNEWWSSQLQEEPPPSALIGSMIGPYEITAAIGAGGMGEVFRARRADSADDKEVAIKVVRAGHDSAFILTRFRQERQILAGLDHPNIARLLDGGTSAQGVPYFVMELIDGERITEYCGRHALTIEQRLKLFAAVCRAVQYAHQHGIIHRDIKPGNILVTADGVPKLLDFGIAKLLEPGSDVAYSTSTMSMFRPLTPAYASPEQISGHPVTRSTDIYSLGVVLYELLCRRGPYATSDGTPDDLARAVRETDPLPPSKAATAAVGDQPEPQPVIRERQRRLRGNLDTIVMTALRKEPERRYASAEDFARDIELHLAGQPIRARRDSLVYRAAKFGRRNSLLLVAASLVLVAIAAAVATRRWQPRSNPALPPSFRVRPSVAVLGFRNTNSDPAGSWISPALSEVLYRTLAAGGQFRTVSRNLVTRSKIDLGIGDAEVLDRAQSNRMRAALDADYIILGSYFPDRDQIRVDLRAQDTRSGETIASVSESGSSASLVPTAMRAGTHLRQRLGITDLTSAEAQSLSASFPSAPEAMRDYSQGVEKLNLLDAEGARATLLESVAKEPGHALSHEALSNAWSMLGYESRAADEAKKAIDLSAPLPRPDQLSIQARFEETSHHHSKALEVRQALFRLFPDDIEYGLRLAESQIDNNRAGDAIETIKVLRQLPDPAGSDPRIPLAEAQAALAHGDYALQEKAATEAIQRAEAIGSRSIAALAHLRLGTAMEHTKGRAQAQPSLMTALQLFQSIGDDHGAAMVMNELGIVFHHLGNLPAARHYYEEEIAGYRRVGDNSNLAGALGNFAGVLLDLGEEDEALSLYKQELAVVRDIDNRHRTITALNNIGLICQYQGRLAQAADNFGQAVALARELGDTAFVASTLDGLGGVQLLLGDVPAALNSFNEELAAFRKVGDDEDAVIALGNIGQALAMSGDLKMAEQNLVQALASTRKSGEKHYIAQNLTELGMVHFYEARDEDARKEFEEAIALHDQMGEKFTQEETRLDLAELELAQARYEKAASQARAALSEAEKEHMRREQFIAHTTLARIFARERRADKAHSELSFAAHLAPGRQDFAARIWLTIAQADVAQRGLSATSRRELEAAAAEAQQHALAPYELQAILLLGIEDASSKANHDCNRLHVLRADASRRGFQRISEAAASVCP